MSNRSCIPVLCLGGLALAAPQDLAVSWYSVPVPGVDRLDRADMGLAGEAEPGGPLMDALGGGSRNHTGMGLSYQRDRADLDGGAWSRRMAGFDLDAVLEGTEGLVFGLEAMDLQPKPSAQTSDVDWAVEEPQGGLRLGIGADALRLVREKRDWTWSFGLWIPVYSSSMDWELQTALVRTRTFRLDFSAAWNDPSTPANLSRVDDDTTTISDTIRWRSSQRRFSARVGFSPMDGLAVQAWSGWRREEDPGPQTDAAWCLSGASWFGGAQGAWAAGDWGVDGEARFDEGHEQARLDTGATGGLDPSGRAAGRAHHSMANGRLELRGPVVRASRAPTMTAQPVAAVQGAWMRLDGTESGSPVQPWSKDGAWGEEHRWEGEAGLRGDFPWLSLEPRIGIQRREMTGDPPRLWWGFPAGSGTSWSLPWQARIFRETPTGSRISYRISGEIRLAGNSAFVPGLRHEVGLGQEF